MDNKKIIFYDGYCALCNSFCAFLLNRLERHPHYFGMLYHSQAYQEASFVLDEGIDSVVFWDGNRVYTYSDAVMQIFKHMDGPWKLVAVLRFVPRSIRDVVYRFIARYRKSFLSPVSTCELYSKERRERILC